MESDGASTAGAILTLNAARTAESDEAVFLSCGPSSEYLRSHASIRAVRFCRFRQSKYFVYAWRWRRRAFGVQAWMEWSMVQL